MLVATTKIKRSNSYYYTMVLVAITFLTLVTDWYEPLLFALSGTVFLFILDKLGKGIVLRELVAFHGCFISLIMPWVGYQWYTINDPLAKLWYRYMPVPAETYFGYALPAMALFTTAICWPIKKKEVDDEGDYMYKYILRLQVVLEKKPGVGIQILLVGIGSAIITPFLPASLMFVGNLLMWSAFAGILCIYFTPKMKFKRLILAAFLLLIIQQTLREAMFTIVAYMGITIFSFFFLQRKSPMWKKISIFAVGIFLLFVIQSVKSAYRKATWLGNFEGNRIGLFSDLVSNQLGNVSDMSLQETMFPIYYRTNQGFNLGLVMRKFPAKQDFDNGSQLAVVVASSFVPRFLWPDKPEAGGKFNMKYYAGVNIIGYSTNVGPMGEAYASFGVIGGAIYLLFLGMFIRWFYARVFITSRKIPLLILWIPVLFYQVTYSGENDTLQILNSLLKSAFLIFILYKIMPSLFGQGRHLAQKKPTQQSLA